jgi:hypothetical protein
MIDAGTGQLDSGVAPPCTYQLVPYALNFGLTQPGATQTATLSIEDVGSTDCWISDVQLSADTQSAFSLPEGALASQRLSPPNSGGQFPSSLLVNVAFSPSEVGKYQGFVEFTVNDPQQPNVSVSLSGIGESTCPLVQPQELNFGVVGISNGQLCSKGKKKFVVVNGCAAPSSVLSVDIESGGAFLLLSGPSLPSVVPQGQTSDPFVVGFQPSAAGSYTGTIHVWTDARPEPYAVWLSGSAVAGMNLGPLPPDTFSFAGSYTFTLSNQPDPTTLAVSVNDTPLSSLDWSYDATTNSVTIDSEFVTLLPGNVIVIAYRLPGLVCN